jgi:hypothetical protein
MDIFCGGADDDDEHHRSEGIISHRAQILHVVETFTTSPCNIVINTIYRIKE